ncbi:MAG: hypothetical protein VKO19_03270 [Cyanobacteriota bacterium]|nr:hypothetical protein [Cyanobacteriota bacterium]
MQRRRNGRLNRKATAAPLRRELLREGFQEQPIQTEHVLDGVTKGEARPLAS